MSPVEIPREPRRREARRDPFAPRLADPFRSLLPLCDSFGEPRQIGARGDEQCGLNDDSGPVLGVGCWACTEEQPGLAGEQIRPSSRYLLELWRDLAERAAVAAGDVCASGIHQVRA